MLHLARYLFSSWGKSRKRMSVEERREEWGKNRGAQHKLGLEAHPTVWGVNVRGWRDGKQPSKVASSTDCGTSLSPSSPG